MAEKILIYLAAITAGLMLALLVSNGLIFLPAANQPVTCTMEAMLCPDGSAVGRIGPKCEFAACPSVTPDVTADWQTYRNEEHGFSLTLPPDWQEIIDEKRGIPGDIKFQSNSFDLVGPEEQEKIFVRIWSRESAPVCKNQKLADCYLAGSERGPILNQSNIQIADLPVIRLQFQKEIDYLFEKNDELVIISSMSENELFNQILSTFKFIE